MEHLKTAATASLGRSTASLQPSKQRQALILRCQKVLFSAYRADQYADPDGFMNSLGAVLEQYQDEVVVYVTDPRTGIQRRLKWPPTISEVIEACDEHREHLERVRTRRAVPISHRLERPAPMAGDHATIFVPENNPRYAQLVEWARTADTLLWKYGLSSDNRKGIWVAYDIWDQRQIAAAKKLSEITALPPDKLTAHYSEYGLEFKRKEDAA